MSRSLPSILGNRWLGSNSRKADCAEPLQIYIVCICELLVVDHLTLKYDEFGPEQLKSSILNIFRIVLQSPR